MIKKIFFNCINLFLLFQSCQSLALTFALPSKGDDLIGHVQTAMVQPGDTFARIGQRYDIGYYEMIEANPGIDPEEPTPWTHVIVPTQFILPPAPRQGIVINLAELRIYYYTTDKKHVMTFPVGIGRQGTKTPAGLFKIIGRRKDPIWYVPASIRKQRAKEGVFLPKRVMPGPDNPLGKYALRLSLPTYLIHGTNDSSGVGRRSSAGCIRMYPKDIKTLHDLTNINTMVHIINKPNKVTWHHNELYLESHLPLQEQQAKGQTNLTLAVKVIDKILNKKHKNVEVDWTEVEKVATAENGIPEVVAYKNVNVK